jgi:type 1 glutamine amidotransferase
MKRILAVLLFTVGPLLLSRSSFSAALKFKVLAFYSNNVEPDHVLFAENAIRFFSDMAASEHFAFDATTDWNNLNGSYLRSYRVVMWLNDSPRAPAQRAAFQKYMDGGGAWLGFHAAGYNDSGTHWPWFVSFLGGAVFDANSWPPLPANLRVDDPGHPIASRIPATFLSPANEWYLWKPSPRLNKNVRVLVTLDPSNYPLGLKDVLRKGDVPVVWTNTKYKMIYMNMGHGDKIFTGANQNRMMENAINWLGNR